VPPIVKTDLVRPFSPVSDKADRPPDLHFNSETEEAENTLGPLHNGERKTSEQISPTDINSAAPLLHNGKDSTESPFTFAKPSSETHL